MSKAVRISAPIPVSTASSSQTDSNQFVPIALFSTIGLLVSLVSILLGVQGAWY